MPDRRSMSTVTRAATAAAAATLLAAGALAVVNAGPATGAVPRAAAALATTTATTTATTAETTTTTTVSRTTTTTTIRFCDPSPPDAVLASATETSLTFTYTSHGDVCGSTGTTLVRLYSENGNYDSYVGQGTGSGKTGTLTISGLTAGTAYYFVTSGGGSPFSSGFRGPVYTAGTVTQPVCTPATNAGLALTELALPAGWKSVTVVGLNEAGTVLGNATAPDGVQHAVTWSAAGAFTDLPVLPGTSYVHAQEINAAGTVIGYLSVTGATSSQAVIWRRGRLSVLSGPGGRPASAVALADDGSVVGNAPDQNFVTHAVRWNASGRPSLLPTLPGAGSSSVSQGNRYGQAVGSSAVAAEPYGTSHLVFWERSGRLTDLQSAPDAPSLWPALVSDGGVVAGTAGVTWSRSQGFRTLPGPDGTGTAYITDMNASGGVLGNAYAAAVSQVYRWDAAWVPQLLPLLDGRKRGWPVDLNDAGVAIGSTSLYNDVPHGTRWGPSGAPEDLGGVTSCDRSEPVAINNAGVIAGTIRPAGAAPTAAVPVVWRPVTR